LKICPLKIEIGLIVLKDYLSERNDNNDNKWKKTHAVCTDQKGGKSGGWRNKVSTFTLCNVF